MNRGSLTVILLGLFLGCGEDVSGPVVPGPSPAPPSSLPLPASAFVFPLASWEPAQPFGNWNGARHGYHLADDMRAPPGTPILATQVGTVKLALGNNIPVGYGGLLIVEHQSPRVTSLYGHVSTRWGFPVGAGDHVERGQVIGYVADKDEAGGTTNPHLHFGIRRGGYSEEELCGVWLYVGYSRECDIGDEHLTHEDYLSMWLRPSTFIPESQRP